MEVKYFRELFYNPACNQLVAIVHNYGLSARYSTFWDIEKHFDTTFAILDALDILILLTISNLRFCFKWEISRCTSPMPINSGEFRRIQLQFLLCSDSDGIFRYIFSDHKERRTSSHLNPFSLSDCITKGSFVLSKYLPLGVNNISRLLFEAFFEEFLHAHLSDKTESLAVFPLSIRQTCFSGNLPNFCLMKVSDREKSVRKLELVESRKEIGLVLGWIDSLIKME